MHIIKHLPLNAGSFLFTISLEFWALELGCRQSKIPLILALPFFNEFVLQTSTHKSRWRSLWQRFKLEKKWSLKCTHETSRQVKQSVLWTYCFRLLYLLLHWSRYFLICWCHNHLNSRERLSKCKVNNNKI